MIINGQTRISKTNQWIDIRNPVRIGIIFAYNN